MGKAGTKQEKKKKDLQIYFDHNANIQIYLNINNEIILIQIFIQSPKYSNIQIFMLIPVMVKYIFLYSNEAVLYISSVFIIAFGPLERRY